MRKLWIRWVALAVFVVLLGALFIRLGEWQLHRLEWRRESNAQVTSHQQLPVKPWTEVFTGQPITDADQWQRVTVTGRYDAQHQLIARYKKQGGVDGVDVITPLVTADGRTVLVDRGFIEVEPNSPVSVAPAPPSGQVTVVGYVRRSERGKPRQVTPVEGTVRLVNAPAIGSTLGLKLEDGYVQLISSDPQQPGTLTPVPTPELTEGPHLSYAVQWFLFTVIAAGGAVVLVRSDLKERRKRAERAARKAQQAAESEEG